MTAPTRSPRSQVVMSLHLATLVTLFLASRAGLAGEGPRDRAADTASLEATLTSLYDVISGPAGPRDWDRLRNLCVPGARLIPCGKRPDGSIVTRVLSVDDFVKASEPGLRKSGFFEREIARKVERFGAVAHVFSTYESRHAREDAQPFTRGINSIQLFFDGHRWWIVTIFWDSERPGQSIPQAYLPDVRPSVGKPPGATPPR